MCVPEPRAYQLVPLLMALRLDVKRLLIADDVGIGKTVEAGMILREMIDRGEVERFSVLCPPHLVDQWVGELAEKFDIDAVAVTSARARSLERGLALGDTIFGVYPYTVVSLDYIKADSRRESFAQACPGFVIVDEAHTCVGGSEKGTQQRYALLERLAEDATRHLLLLTATPHSGNQDAYARLLSLLHGDLADGPEAGDQNARRRYADRLAKHFVQRRRPDISDKWGEAGAFAKSMKADAPYTLTGDFQNFQEDVLEYCLGVATRADGERARRLAFWGTLALMRCIGSSPAAALSALRNRLGGMAEGHIVVQGRGCGLRFDLNESALGRAGQDEFQVYSLLRAPDLAHPAPTTGRENQIDEELEVLPGEGAPKKASAKTRSRSETAVNGLGCPGRNSFTSSRGAL